jgi:putative PEP-CTERM system TPR-repeat lipoprotein
MMRFVRLLLLLGAALVGIAQFTDRVLAADYVAQAESFLAKGQLKAAEIELKKAIQADPQNMAAHYRLATVQMQLGEAAAAEHEAKTARAGGYDPDHTVPLVAETYLLQQKYKQLLDEFPENQGGVAERAGVLVARGYAQLALRKPEEAGTSFKAAQALTPDAPQPILAEAKLLVSQHQLAAAEPLFDRALKLDPKSNEARIGKANLLRANGKPDQAIALLDELVADAPAYVPARIERAEILLSQGKDGAAKADVQAALTAQPGSVAGIYLDALLAAKAQDFEKANADLQKISGAMGSIPAGYYVQAFVEYRLGHFEQAADAAQRYTARNPDELAGKKLLGYIDLALRRPADTIDALSKFEADGKADAEALDLLGRAYTQLGKTAEALAAFGAAAKLVPGNAGLQARLGQAELRAGHSSQGINDLEQSLNLAPSAPAAEMLVLTDLANGDWQRATDAANKLQQAEPASPVAGNLLGLVKLTQFDLDAARTQFAALMEKNPEFVPARLNLARVLELQGKDEEAEKPLSEALTKQPANGVILSRFVELLLRQGKTDAAIGAAERAHAAAPTNIGITVGLVDLYLKTGDKDKALALARQQSQTDPNNAQAIAARARAEFAAGLKAEVADSFRRLIELAPAQIAYRRQLAALLLSTDDVDGARQAIDKAMEINPNDPQLAADRIAISLKTSGVAGAVATADQLRGKYPNLATAPALQGDAYMAGKEYDKAADAYAKAMQQSPSAMLALRVAQAKANAGDREAAAGVLRDWLSKHPDDAGVAVVLVSYDLAAQRFDQAKAELEHVLEKAPQNPVALNNLAWLDQRAGDPRARALAERAYLLAPNLAQTEDTLGWILVQEGQAANAIGLLKEASGTPSANPAIRYHYAVALNKLGQTAEARKILSELINGPANFDDKPEAEKLLAEISKG